MPIITVQFIKDVVATPEQKRELIIKLTDTFVGVLGEVVRPFVYCLIQETPQQEWGIAGVPMPDLVYLTGAEHAKVIGRSNDLMRAAIAQMQAAALPNGTSPAEEADAVWRGVKSSASNGSKANTQLERNKAIIRHFHQAINEQDVKALRDLIHTQFVNHLGSLGDQNGPQALVDGLKPFFEALPDLSISEDYVVAQHDRVATRIKTSGTHKGSYMGIPASGNKVSFTGIVIYRIDEAGKIIERWQDFDSIGMMQQLGVMPAMA